MEFGRSRSVTDHTLGSLERCMLSANTMLCNMGCEPDLSWDGAAFGRVIGGWRPILRRMTRVGTWRWSESGSQ